MCTHSCWFPIYYPTPYQPFLKFTPTPLLLHASGASSSAPVAGELHSCMVGEWYAVVARGGWCALCLCGQQLLSTQKRVLLCVTPRHMRHNSPQTLKPKPTPSSHACTAARRRETLTGDATVRYFDYLADFAAFDGLLVRKASASSQQSGVGFWGSGAPHSF